MIRKIIISVSMMWLCQICYGAPANSLSYGNSWMCKNGFKKVGDTCEKVYVPTNAIAFGDTWMCKNGFKKVDSGCVVMNEQEKLNQLHELAKIRARSRNHYSQDNCESLSSYASDAETYARRAQNASDFDECSDYARKAKNYASDAYSYANSCY
jgi:hypothetical protein